MDILKRNLAPISDAAWAEIDNTARDVLRSNLTARRLVDVPAPRGIGYTSVDLGRLTVEGPPEKAGVQWGVYSIQPLVEARVFFSLKTWELDNINRGARDIDLSPLEEAARKVAVFENSAVLNGLGDGNISGLLDSAGGSTIKLNLSTEGVVDAVSDALISFQSAGVAGPYNLAVSPSIWKFMAHVVPGGTLKNQVEKLIGGKVIYSDAVKDALMVSARGGDAELILGQDLAIGYHHHTSEEVILFLTESFTFQVITPESLVVFKQ